jgi:hypothetical protein
LFIFIKILKDLLKKMELPTIPNVTVDYNNLRFIAPNNQRIRALIEQSRREHNQEHRRVRKVGYKIKYFKELDF